MATALSGFGAPTETSRPAGAAVDTHAPSDVPTAPPSFPVDATASPGDAASDAPSSDPASEVTPAPDTTAPPEAPAAQRPAEVVLAFYVAVATHDWEVATELWSPDMQLRYPPDANIIDRFAATQRIHINTINAVDVDRAAGTARVEVTFLEYRTDEPSPRRWIGAWDLVRIDGHWLLDNPDF